MPSLRITPDDKLDVTLTDILTEALQDRNFRHFIRLVPPNKEWKMSIAFELIIPDNTLALELLDKLEEAEFKEKNS